jgi:hypothetical protein
VVRLRKPHACGTNEWELVRLGADIGLRCQHCGHRILLARRELERRLTAFIRRPERAEPPADLDLSPPRGD